MVTDRHMVPSRYPEVDDERIVVFFDGTDSVWGGCNDFEERYLRLERATGDQYQYMPHMPRMHCECALGVLHLCAASALHLRCICAAGARLVMSAEMHCGGSTPTPPGCAGTPDPPRWVAGPMTPRRAREFNSCLPPEAGLKVRGAHCSSPPAYKFLNSGLYAGRAGEVRSLLRSALLLPRELILNNKSSEDDQTATIRVWHEGKHKARSLSRPLAAAHLLRPHAQEGATLCVTLRKRMQPHVSEDAAHMY